ncbi:MAG: hypothetical protein BWY74_00339 [Firmicutes bacterium ADurb.Bin419]|nr:MAG: hypothetical protein BWY74_00339 [Firmicutes bacterium ADurb.Bin419]
MAQRRMLSNRITNSGKFLKMPQTSQALYFHLNINADDDGIVEAYQIIRLGGFGEDDLKVLASKNFIKVLNEDLVTYILDWKEHNLIRADRKIDSIYKKLLIKIMPEIKLISAKKRADTKQKTRHRTGENTGRPLDNQWTAQVRLGKDRLGKDSISKDNNTTIVVKSKIYDEKDIELVELLYSLIRINYPFIKEKSSAKKENDYDEMRKIREIDKYTPDQIKYIIQWSQQDEFWKQNIRSVSKLRKQFETLIIRAGNENNNRQITINTN